MEKWIRFEPDRTVRLAVGKVELGQGNVTALAQIAADELDVDLARISVCPAILKRRRMRARPPRANRSRYRDDRCDWSRRNCVRGYWNAWHGG